jgi:hypothetical protein
MLLKNLKIGEVYFNTSNNRFVNYRGVDEDSSLMFSQAEFYDDSKTGILIEKFNKSYVMHLCDCFPNIEYGFHEHIFYDGKKSICVSPKMTFNKRTVLLEKTFKKIGQFKMLFPGTDVNGMVGMMRTGQCAPAGCAPPATSQAEPISVER